MSDRIKPIDFESTVQLDLSKLNDLPYGSPSTVEISVSDLSAELDDLADEFSFPDAKPDNFSKTVNTEINPGKLDATVSLDEPPIPQKPTAKKMTPASRHQATATPKPRTKKPTPQPVAASTETIESTPLFDLSEELLDLPKDEPKETVSKTPPPKAKASPQKPKIAESKTVPPHTAKPTAALVEQTMIAPPSKSNGTFAILVGMIGLIAGSTGIWMASNANIQMVSLERQIESLETQLRTHVRDTAIVPTPEPILELKTTDEQAMAPTNSAETKTPASTPVEVATPPIAQPITPITPVTKTSPKASNKAGDWVVFISSHQSQSRAKKAQTRLKKLGIDTNIQVSTVKNKIWYRVVSDGFSSKKEAYTHLNMLKKNKTVQGAWVGKTSLK